MGIRAPLLDCVHTAGLALLPTLQATGLRWAQAAFTSRAPSPALQPTLMQGPSI